MYHYCWFCGRPFIRPQAFNAHLKWCTEKKAYELAKKEGFLFKIGSVNFRVRTMRFKWLREAEKIMKQFNAQIADGTMSEAKAQELFNWYVASHQDNYSSVLVAVEFLPAHKDEEIQV